MNDQSQREQALDITQSFIVQAPAGSGKTELLTQRFLCLLTSVQEPEEVLAITFTKKAASEMRSRIRDALKKAQIEPEPTTPHHQKTWQLARRVIKQDQANNWGLLDNPNRLRIKTIDAFNTLLTRQLPLLSHFGAQPEIINYSKPLYREAVQIFLGHLEENVEWSKAIARLLLHLDNNMKLAEDLLIEMLSKRDQWLPYIIAHQNHPSLRKMLESNLAGVITDTLAKLNESFPSDCVADLCSLIQFAAHNLAVSNSESPILACAHLTCLPGASLQDRAAWLGISELLLTKEREWRRRIDIKTGFPPVDKNDKTKLNDNMKQCLKDLIEHLSHNEKLHSAFIELHYLPKATYTNKQWEILEALHEVLKIVVAQLHVVFKQVGKIDYTENAQAALLALGYEESPTDLALALDYQIKHLLVDEFQDTSHNQFRLLKKLVHHWQPSDGHTLFLVGDPMQSIYRFREAEVGLFIRSKQQGIGPIQLTPLTLSVNFRSRPEIVEWINGHFSQIMPPFDDIASGAVSYSTSFSPLNNEKLQAVHLHALDNQAQKIINIIRHTPDGNIAILVRSRHHLEDIIPALKAENIAYQAIDIDPLISRPLIQDLLALTRALLYPADRIAWLSILRSPLCGLTLSDLLILAGTQYDFIWQQIKKTEIITALSKDGQTRLARVQPVLEAALAERFREDIHHWVNKTWVGLGGPACAENEAELQDAAIFFNLLKDVASQSTNIKWVAIQEAIEKLYAPNHTPARVQIMTIHNAKGLEFDTVILPHLEKGTHNHDKPLLTWIERPLMNNHSALLLAPIQALEDEEDAIYQHIRQQDHSKTRHENSRLLYVAATRAKKNLHLLMTLKTNTKGDILIPPDNSLLKKLWPVIQNEIGIAGNQVAPLTLRTLPQHGMIKRLVSAWKNPVQGIAHTIRLPHNKIQGFHLSQSEASTIGTVIHYLLQQLSLHGAHWWLNIPAKNRVDYIRLQLMQAKLPPSALTSSIAKVELAIQNTLEDERGIWVIQPRDNAQSELAITAQLHQEIKRLVIDRTFIDENNIRWLMDDKTSVPQNIEPSLFMLKESEKYAEQLQHYQKAMSLLDNRELKIGLYFPLFKGWLEII